MRICEHIKKPNNACLKGALGNCFDKGKQILLNCTFKFSLQFQATALPPLFRPHLPPHPSCCRPAGSIAATAAGSKAATTAATTAAPLPPLHTASMLQQQSTANLFQPPMTAARVARICWTIRDFLVAPTPTPPFHPRRTPRPGLTVPRAAGSEPCLLSAAPRWGEEVEWVGAETASLLEPTGNWTHLCSSRLLQKIKRTSGEDISTTCVKNRK